MLYCFDERLDLALIEAGIDSNVIEKLIEKNEQNRCPLSAQVYNLEYPGDTPLRRIITIMSAAILPSALAI